MKEKFSDEWIEAQVRLLTKDGPYGQCRDCFKELDVVDNLVARLCFQCESEETNGKDSPKMDCQICRTCGHLLNRHEIEPPYPCYDCDCQSFSYVNGTEREESNE